jgi:hypothetical protein
VWSIRLYDESYQLLLKRSKRRLLEERGFLASSEDREALSRTDYVRALLSRVP